MIIASYLSSKKPYENYKKPLIITTRAFFASLLIWALFPTEKASYMMVGGYLTEHIINNDQFNTIAESTGVIGEKLNTIVNQKLDEYLKNTDSELSQQPSKVTK